MNFPISGTPHLLHFFPIPNRSLSIYLPLLTLSVPTSHLISWINYLPLPVPSADHPHTQLPIWISSPISSFFILHIWFHLPTIPPLSAATALTNLRLYLVPCPAPTGTICQTFSHSHPQKSWLYPSPPRLCFTFLLTSITSNMLTIFLLSSQS